MPHTVYLGAMTGSSLDGLDIAAVAFADDVAPASRAAPANIIAHTTYAMPTKLRAAIVAISQGQRFGMADWGAVDIGVARFYRDKLRQFMQEQGLSPTQIAAIGMHGQTVHHQPPSQHPPGAVCTASPDEAPLHFTLQLGDPYVVATGLGCPVVADFRRRDLALGGQGAPLAPAFHRLAFAHAQQWRVVLNLGGIANITVLEPNAPTRGYDTGPANMLLDAWIQLQRGLAFDADGAWAATGQLHPALLAALRADAYFAQPPPKSTGRERFSLAWLQERLQAYADVAPVDVQRTLVELTASTVADAVLTQYQRHCQQQTTTPAAALIVCGGGARNALLLARLQALCPALNVHSSSDFGILPEAVEAAAFAFFARCTRHGLVCDLSEVTGASRAALLGTVFWP